MIHGLFKFDVAKVTGAVDLGAHARSAVTVTIHGAHLVIVDAVGDWVTISVVSEDIVDVGDRHGIDLLGAEDGERHSIHFVEFNIAVFNCSVG